MLVKIFLLELPLLDIRGLLPVWTTCVSRGSVHAEQSQYCSGSSAVSVLLHQYFSPVFDAWIPKPVSSSVGLPVEWIQTSWQQACFSFLSAIDPLVVVYSSSGPVVHRLKAADVDKYLNKSDLLTLLVFIFLQSGYLLVPYSCNTHLQLKYGKQIFLRALFLTRTSQRPSVL